MKPLQAEDIYGNWATLLLPIDSSGAIDYGQLEEELDILISSRPNGIYSGGTAGEFYTLNEDEFDRINELLAQKCERAHIPFQVGVNHPSPQIALERLKRSSALKPGAFQVILPDWFPVSLPEAEKFLQRMAAEANETGLVLYNPPHAKKVLKPKEWAALKKTVPTLIGMKLFDHDGDDAWYGEVRKHGEGLSVFVPGHNLATGIVKGAQGAYSNMACLNPFGAQHWYDMMQSDLDSALEIEQRIQKFLADYITPYITKKNYSNQAVDKLLAAIGGWGPISPRLRWPYQWISESAADELRPIVQKALPNFLAVKQYTRN